MPHYVTKTDYKPMKQYDVSDVIRLLYFLNICDCATPDELYIISKYIWIRLGEYEKDFSLMHEMINMIVDKYDIQLRKAGYFNEEKNFID